MIIGIVAVAQNRAIGKGGKLPWHYSADLKFFKQTTTGNAVVMGSTTWQSLGKPLPDRLNIVLSRKGDIEVPQDVLVLRSKDAVAALTKYLNCDVYIIGGAKVFESFAGMIEKWFVTEIPIEVEDADAFMSRSFLTDFEDEGSSEIEPGLIVNKFRRKANLGIESSKTV